MTVERHFLFHFPFLGMIVFYLNKRQEFVLLLHANMFLLLASSRACLLRIQSSELKQKLANKFLENQLYKLSLDSCRYVALSIYH